MRALLLPTLELGRDETPTSFVSRLAVLHHIEGARMLATDLGFAFKDVVDGNPTTLAHLASISGAKPARLIENAVRREVDGWRVRGQLMLKSSMQRTSVRLCPACIAEDLARTASRGDVQVQGRLHWQVVSIRTCHMHDMAIVDAIAAPHAHLAHDFAQLVVPAATRLAALAETAQRRSLSGFEAYLIGRLENAAGSHPWLDSLEFAAAARICEIIGAIVLRGREPKLLRFSDDDWQTAGEAGFSVAAGGPASICAWLSELQASYAYSRAGTEGPQALYGVFYKFLGFQATDAVFDPIRDLVREHIVATMPVGAGEIVLGKTVDRRRLHSVYSASLETRLHPKRLQKLLIGAGVLDEALADANNARQIFGADQLHAVFENERQAISQQQVETYINAGRVHTQLVIDQGFIKPLPAPDGAASRYAKADLDRFVARLLEAAEPVEVPRLPICTIPAAAKRANCSAAEIIHMILERKLAWVGRLETTPGYLSVLVDLDEIKRAVRGAPIVDGFTARQLEHELKTTTRVITMLLAHGAFQPVTMTNPVNRCPVQIIPRGQVDAFNAEYVSLTNLAKERGIHFRALSNELAAAGIKPALNRETYGATFFRRTDVGLPALTEDPT